MPTYLLDTDLLTEIAGADAARGVQDYAYVTADGTQVVRKPVTDDSPLHGLVDAWVQRTPCALGTIPGTPAGHVLVVERARPITDALRPHANTTVLMPVGLAREAAGGAGYLTTVRRAGMRLAEIAPKGPQRRSLDRWLETASDIALTEIDARHVLIEPSARAGAATEAAQEAVSKAPEPDIPEPDIPEPDIPEPDIPELDTPEPGAPQAPGDQARPCPTRAPLLRPPHP